jgi:hypothetical protein
MSVALIGDQPYVYACHIWFDCPPAGRTVRTQRLWRFRGSGLCMDSQSASASRQSKVSTATSAHAADRAGNTVVGSTRRALALRDGRVVLYEPCATGVGTFLPPHRFRLHADIPMLPAAGNIMRPERADRPGPCTAQEALDALSRSPSWRTSRCATRGQAARQHPPRDRHQSGRMTCRREGNRPR